MTLTWDGATASVAGRICRRLDGSPLAIELAAARLRVMSLTELDARLDQRFAILTGGSRTALPRQQTLLAMLDWSWELLNSAERQVLARLSVFAGGFDLAAAEAVTAGEDMLLGEIVRHLGALVDKNLVQFEDSGGGRCVTGCWKPFVSMARASSKRWARRRSMMPGLLTGTSTSLSRKRQHRSWWGTIRPNGSTVSIWNSEISGPRSPTA